MTRQIHNQFGKELLAELVQPLGQVGVNQEIHAETYHADLSFVPSPTATAAQFQRLGQLGQMITQACQLEYFWKPPTLGEVRCCLLKLFSWYSQLQRAAKPRKGNVKPIRLTDRQLPQLWLVTTSLPGPLWQQCVPFRQLTDDHDGVYPFGGELLKTAIVVIDQLPLSDETVWLRLLGQGATQEAAVETVLTWIKTDPSLSTILEIIYKWCTLLDTKPRLTQPEKELLMNLSAAYQEARQQAVPQGRLGLVTSLLKSRFGKIDKTLSIVIEPLV